MKSTLILILLFNLFQLTSSFAEPASLEPERNICSLTINGPNIWRHHADWFRIGSSFQDRNVSWISPMPQLAADATTYHCGGLPQGKKAILVSSFSISRPQEVLVESLLDNYGTLSIWKNHDSSKVIARLVMHDKSYSARMVVVEPAEYSIVIELHDTGGSSGAVASVSDIGGTTIRHTDGTWQAYLAPKHFVLTSIP